MQNPGFQIEVTSRFEGWWRYNVALMAGCFDADEVRKDFATASSHIAEVGTNLAEPPAGREAKRKIVLETAPCDHLLLYLYVIPHTLPAGNEIDTPRPFDIEVRISYDGKLLCKKQYAINQWSGASIETKIEKE